MWSRLLEQFIPWSYREISNLCPLVAEDDLRKERHSLFPVFYWIVPAYGTLIQKMMLLSWFAQHLHLISPLKRLLGHFGSLYWSIYLVKFDHSGIAFDHWMNYKKYDFFLFHILWWFFFLWWFKQPENSNIRTNLLLRIPDVWDSPVVAFTILHQTGTKCLLIFQPKSQISLSPFIDLFQRWRVIWQ